MGCSTTCILLSTSFLCAASKERGQWKPNLRRCGPRLHTRRTISPRRRYSNPWRVWRSAASSHPRCLSSSIKQRMRCAPGYSGPCSSLGRHLVFPLGCDRTWWGALFLQLLRVESASSDDERVQEGKTVDRSSSGAWTEAARPAACED
jgi:hypothetical protein